MLTTYTLMVANNTHETDERSIYLSQFEEEYRRRNDGWQNLVVTTMPNFTLTREKVYLGHAGHSYVQSKMRYILRSQAIDIGFGPMTPSMAVRYWLSVTYPKRKPRMTRYQKAALIDNRPSPPLYCAGETYGTGVYIDIKSAYWSIVRATGWRVEYNPGKYLGRVGDVFTFPVWWHKVARNSLVSLGLPGHVQVWNGEKITGEKLGSTYMNMLLWGVVQHVLNGVAHDMVRAGAVYVFTDGYIVPYKYSRLAIEVMDAWGLPYSVKDAGVYHVKAPGAYKFDDRATKPYERARPREVDKISVPHVDWLRSRFRWCTERIEPLIFTFPHDNGTL